MFALLVTAAWACSARAADCPADAEPVVIPPAPLAEPLTDAALGGLVGSTSPALVGETVGLGEGARGALWSTCDDEACVGWIARIAADGTPSAPVALPGRGWAIDGIALDASGLVDLSGDGAPEWVVRFRVIEPPRRAVGSLTHEILAVYRLPDLALLGTVETRRAGAGSETACQTELRGTSRGYVTATRCDTRDVLEGGASTAPERCAAWATSARKRRP